VKKDFITQCDWLVWHRLTWGNDTKVVGRMLSKEHEAAVEDLGDGEGFLVTDWSESVRRVQFHRKQTFDAGATPGLDDFERPELKSVSGDLVSDLREISDERERRESELAELRQELDKRERRIRELERELEEARDLSNMADKFASAMLSKADATHRGGSGRNFERPEEKQAALEEYERSPDARSEAETGEAGSADGTADDAESAAEAGDATDPSDPVGGYPGFDPEDGSDATAGSGGAPDSDAIASGAVTADGQRAIVHTLREFVAGLNDVSRGMLAHYREAEVADPIDAHVAAGASGDRTLAYARNKPLRESGLVRRVSRDAYAYALPDLVREEYADRLGDGELDETVAAVEAAFVTVGPGDGGPGDDGEGATSGGESSASRRRSGDTNRGTGARSRAGDGGVHDDVGGGGGDGEVGDGSSPSNPWPTVADSEE
jgi:TolA-binding protein